jgi:hypothetical protein
MSVDRELVKPQRLYTWELKAEAVTFIMDRLVFAAVTLILPSGRSFRRKIL